jgi:histidinol-phosphatase (PHP family)
MKYYDQHLHTFLSFDSEEQFENYLAYQPEFFVATDHFDLKNPYSNYRDDIPDYEKLQQCHHSLQDKTATKLLKGIEIGVVPGQETQIREYLVQHPYDLKLVSIHQNGTFDYMDDAVLQKDKFIVAKMYFEQMATVLDTFLDGHILTHFDYGLRRFDFTAAELAEHFEQELTTIFKKVVARELAFEVNAKSFGPYQNAALYEYAIPLYQSVGGKLFTLGSDAHKASDYRLLFPEMSAMLRSFGVEQLAVFQGNERFMTGLAD